MEVVSYKRRKIEAGTKRRLENLIKGVVEEGRRETYKQRLDEYGKHDEEGNDMDLLERARKELDSDGEVDLNAIECLIRYAESKGDKETARKGAARIYDQIDIIKYPDSVGFKTGLAFILEKPQEEQKNLNRLQLGHFLSSPIYESDSRAFSISIENMKNVLKECHLDEDEIKDIGTQAYYYLMRDLEGREFPDLLRVQIVLKQNKGEKITEKIKHALYKEHPPIEMDYVTAAITARDVLGDGDKEARAIKEFLQSMKGVINNSTDKVTPQVDVIDYVFSNFKLTDQFIDEFSDVYLVGKLINHKFEPYGSICDSDKVKACKFVYGEHLKRGEFRKALDVADMANKRFQIHSTEQELSDLRMLCEMMPWQEK